MGWFLIMDLVLVIVGCVFLTFRRDQTGQPCRECLFGGVTLVTIGSLLSPAISGDLNLGYPSLPRALETNAIYEVVATINNRGYENDGDDWLIALRDQEGDVRLYRWTGAPPAGIVKAVEKEGLTTNGGYELKLYPAPPATPEEG